MIAIIVEVEPAAGREDEFLDTAAKMRPMVDQFDMFISIERDQAPTDRVDVLRD